LEILIAWGTIKVLDLPRCGSFVTETEIYLSIVQAYCIICGGLQVMREEEVVFKKKSQAGDMVEELLF
jgi:hypothetical protein